jgi:hypothetical protein
MIFVVVHEEWTENGYQKVVSHGIDTDTLENVVLPQVDPRELGAKKSLTFDGWVLDNL